MKTLTDDCNNSHEINSADYWDSRFKTGSWIDSQGKEQTLFFGQLAINHMPAWFSKYVKEKKLSICDFGCALGQNTKLLATHFPDNKVCGQDISHHAIKTARELFPNLEFTHEDILKTPKSFDIIFSSNTLEHFYNPLEIMEKLAKSSSSFLFFLLPFYDDLKIEEHFYSFAYDNLPFSIDEKFQLVFLKEIDTTHLPNTSWFGKQILIIYAHKTLLSELESQISCHLLLKDKNAYREKMVKTLLAMEHKIKSHELNLQRLKNMAYHTQRLFESQLASEEMSHELTQQKLKELESFNQRLLSSSSWKITSPLRWLMSHWLFLRRRHS